MTDLPTIQLECKKDGLQQLQNGSAKLTLTVNADDINAAIGALWAAPMGTRYQVVMVEIGDDDQPVNRDLQLGDPVKSVTGYAKPPMTEAQRCGMMCSNEAFQGWLKDTFPGRWQWEADQHPAEPAATIAACVVRNFLQIDSRRDLDDSGRPDTLKIWRDIVSQFEVAARLQALEPAE